MTELHLSTVRTLSQNNSLYGVYGKKRRKRQGRAFPIDRLDSLGQGFTRFTDALSVDHEFYGNSNSSNINHMGCGNSIIVEVAPFPYQRHVSKSEGKR